MFDPSTKNSAWNCETHASDKRTMHETSRPTIVTPSLSSIAGELEPMILQQQGANQKNCPAPAPFGKPLAASS
jgi:hypothetical protein